MLDQLLKSMGGSLEGVFLTMIAFVDQAETASHDLAKAGHLTPETVVQIAQLKQSLIEQFATANRNSTLKSIVEKYGGDLASQIIIEN